MPRGPGHARALSLGHRTTTTMTTSRPMPPAKGTIGAFHGIDIADYHGNHDAVSKSALDDFRHDPRLYWANRFDPSKPPEDEKETKARLQGNLLHCAALEPDQFAARYCVIPDDAPRRPSITQRNAKKPSPDTILAIDYWDRLELENAGKKVITAELYDAAWKQADSLRKIKAIRDLMGDGHAEVSEYFTDPITGLYCKIRPDWQKPFASGDVLLDLKTVGAIHDDGLRLQFERNRYHVQDAFYSDGHAHATGRPTLGFLFGAVETEWPYLATVKELDDVDKAEGRRAYKADIAGILRHTDAGIWAPDDGVGVLKLRGFTYEK